MADPAALVCDCLKLLGVKQVGAIALRRVGQVSREGRRRVTATGPPIQIAALLHDGLEDAETPEERADREAILASEFGPAVLRIVLDCTDTTPDEAGASKGAWRPRKERYLEQLRRAGPASRLVAACDKRQNLGDLVSDLRLEGAATLERFNAGAAEQLWYFRSLDAVCRPDLPPKLARELTHLVTELEGLLDA